MPASLTTTLSASAQASTHGAGTRIAASAAKKGTGIIMKKVIIGSIAAVVAVGVVVGIIIGVLSKKADTEPEKITVNSVVDKPQNDADKNTDYIDRENDSNVTEPGIIGYCAVGKITTTNGEFYFKETIGEFIAQFSSDEYRLEICDAEDNIYTTDDLDQVVSSRFVGVNVFHDNERLINLVAENVEETNIRNCMISDFYISSKSVIGIEIRNELIELNKSTIDEAVAKLGDYWPRNTLEESMNSYNFNLSSYELNCYVLKCDDNNIVNSISISSKIFT